MSRVDFNYDQENKTWYMERPFKNNLDLPEEDQLDFVPPTEEGWSVEEVSQVFKSWLDNNERRYVQDMEDPQVRVSLKDKEFQLKFIDTYTYRIRLEEVEKKLRDENGDILKESVDPIPKGEDE